MSDPRPEPRRDDRFQPHAHREMASMFDDVSGRYDLLNRVMTLGQDGHWREAMWAAVPADARVVLDLCTGSGVSLPGLHRVGRTLLGMDVSLRMLQHAASGLESHGWAPRLACADAFRLPLRDGALDAVTVAFGVRNLRPRPAAVAELARVLRPGGTLAVLEASAPAPGPLAPACAFWIRHVIPLAGRLSPDPSAYRYLSESIFEFGDGSAWRRDLAAAGFELAGERAFLFGATRLWVARRGGAAGQKAAGSPSAVQSARPGGPVPPAPALPGGGTWDERRTWALAQALVALALTVALTWGLAVWRKYLPAFALQSWQAAGGWALLGGGWLVFAIRTVVLALRVPRG